MLQGLLPSDAACELPRSPSGSTLTSPKKKFTLKNFFFPSQKIIPEEAKSLSNHEEPRHYDISTDQASLFCEFLPIIMCIMDQHGNIYNRNQLFRETVFIELVPNRKAPNLLEAISLEESDKFYSTLKSIQEGNYSSNVIQCDFMTNIKKKSSKSSYQVYNWSFIPYDNKRFVIVTARAVEASVRLISEEEVNDYSDEMIKEHFTNLMLPANLSIVKEKSPPVTFSESEVWKKFMTRVEIRASRELELQKTQLKAQALTETLETKRIFVRHVSHEIRTPLNVVMSGLEFLISFRSGLSAEVSSTLRDIKTACAVAIDILNDLLTYEKLDSNILTLEKASYDFIELVRKVCNMFQIQAKYREIDMIFENHMNAKTVITEIDSTKISQVIRNLVSNSLKFTPTGGKIWMRLLRPGDSNRVRLEIQDTGPGMTIEQRKKLFKEIVQFNPKELQNGQGSGLGLYISQKIIDLHSGSIGVDMNWDGVGSIFYLELNATDEKEMTPKGCILCLHRIYFIFFDGSAKYFRFLESR